MTKQFSLINRQVLSWIQRTKEHKEEMRNTRFAPIITISREMGSGGRLISRLVAESLGEPWKDWHREIIDEIAGRSNTREELVEQVDEKAVSLIKEYVSELFGLDFLSLPTYQRYLVECLMGLGQYGYAVILGRGANFILKEGLHVRLICPLEKRIQYEIEHEKISKDEAVKRVTRSDIERERFVRDLFGKNINDPSYYDMVINTGGMGLSDAADLIVEAAKKRWKI